MKAGKSRTLSKRKPSSRQHSASGSGTLHAKAAKPVKKAAKAKKRTPVGKAKAAHHRSWSPGWDVACCSAEALVTLRRLSGAPVSWEDTLALYWRTASDPDTGASILATLEAASGSGSGVNYKEVASEVISGPQIYNPCCILGLALPEPHAVAVTPDGTWWSWGEPFDPEDWPDLVIEEAWAVALGR